MSEHEKALIRAALMWHAVNVIAGPRVAANAALSRACQRLLKAHPKRAYRKRSRHE